MEDLSVGTQDVVVEANNQDEVVHRVHNIDHDFPSDEEDDVVFFKRPKWCYRPTCRRLEVPSKTLDLIQIIKDVESCPEMLRNLALNIANVCDVIFANTEQGNRALALLLEHGANPNEILRGEVNSVIVGGRRSGTLHFLWHLNAQTAVLPLYCAITEQALMLYRMIEG